MICPLSPDNMQMKSKGAYRRGTVFTLMKIRRDKRNTGNVWDVINTKAIIIATGAKHKVLGVKGEKNHHVLCCPTAM